MFQNMRTLLRTTTHLTSPDVRRRTSMTIRPEALEGDWCSARYSHQSGG